MFAAGGALATILTLLQPLIEPLLNALGRTLTDYIAGARADKNAQELGRAEAQNKQSQATITAQQAELQAQADAPQDAEDAIKRLEDGTA
jgi:hypothetical protein